MTGLVEGYGALKTAFEMAKGLKDIHDQVKLNSAVIELQSKILEAQDAVSNAKDALRELQGEVDRLNDWKATASRYELKDFGGQTFAYSLRAEKADGEPQHLACPECFRKNSVSVLQYEDIYSGRKRYDCLACGSHVLLGVSEYSDWQRSTDTDYNPYI